MIFTYHALDDSGSVVSLAPHVFREQMRVLADSGVPVVPLREAVRRPGSVALTFDDGYTSFHDVALPELAAHGFPATVFVVSRACGGRAAWPDCANKEIMSWRQLEEARDAGVEIGAHTATHPRLTRIPPEAAQREIDDCSQEIADRLGVRSESFAYPYGDADAGVKRLAAARFPIACGIELKPAGIDSDPIELPRIDIYYFRNVRRFGELLRGARGYLTARRLARGARARLRGR